MPAIRVHITIPAPGGKAMPDSWREALWEVAERCNTRAGLAISAQEQDLWFALRDACAAGCGSRQTFQCDPSLAEVVKETSHSTPAAPNPRDLPTATRATDDTRTTDGRPTHDRRKNVGSATKAHHASSAAKPDRSCLTVETPSEEVTD